MYIRNSITLALAVTTGLATSAFSETIQNSPRYMITTDEAMAMKALVDAPVFGKVSMDGTTIPNAYYTHSMWVDAVDEWQRQGIQENSFLQTITFLGADQDNTEDLGGEIEIWIGDEKFVLTENATVHIPAGMKFGPIIYRNMTAPIHEHMMAYTEVYDTGAVEGERPEQDAIAIADAENGVYINVDVNPNYEGLPPEYATANLLSDKIPGANYHDLGLIKKKPNNPDHGIAFGYEGPHRHNEGEVFWFFSADPETPNDLGATVSFEIGAAVYTTDQSTIMYVPAYTRHLPLNLRDMTGDVWESMTGPLDFANWGYLADPVAEGGIDGLIFSGGVMEFQNDGTVFMNMVNMEETMEKTADQ